MATPRGKLTIDMFKVGFEFIWYDKRLVVKKLICLSDVVLCCSTMNVNDAYSFQIRDCCTEPKVWEYAGKHHYIAGYCERCGGAENVQSGFSSYNEWSDWFFSTVYPQFGDEEAAIAKEMKLPVVQEVTFKTYEPKFKVDMQKDGTFLLSVDNKDGKLSPEEQKRLLEEKVESMKRAIDPVAFSNDYMATLSNDVMDAKTYAIAMLTQKAQTPPMQYTQTPSPFWPDATLAVHPLDAARAAIPECKEQSRDLTSEELDGIRRIYQSYITKGI